MPFVYVAGMWMAVFSSITFTAVYAWRVAEEARLLANALAATELVLQREQHLSALDGLAAAAAHELGTPLATITVVAKEMERALGNDPKFREDVTLLRSQSERCREHPEAAGQPVVGGRGASRPPAADIADRGGDRAASRFRHRHSSRAGRTHRPRAGRAPQSGRHLRSRQSRRKRRRFRLARSSRCTGAGTTRPSPSRSSTTARAFRRKSSTASASLICRPGRARSAAAGWALACSSPRRCWSVPARRCPSSTPMSAGKGAVVQVAWRRDQFLKPAVAAERHVRHRVMWHSRRRKAITGAQNSIIKGRQWVPKRRLPEATGIGPDASLLLVDDDKPFLTRLARAMEARGFIGGNGRKRRGSGRQGAKPCAPAYRGRRYAAGRRQRAGRRGRDPREAGPMRAR